MFQFFLDEPVAFGDTVRIVGDDAHHISRVLRLKTNDRIRVSASDGGSFICEITDFGDGFVLCDAVETSENTELAARIRLFQAIPKGERFDTIVEKCVELGVHEIIPVKMKYCVAKWDGKKVASKVKRYNAIAYAAAKQSKRSIVPEVREPVGLTDACAYAQGLGGTLLIPYENKEGMASNSAAFEAVASFGDISIFIGPEGGFAEEEIKLLSEQKNAHTISLGRRILRTDTAAITSVAQVMMRLEMMDNE